MNIIQKQFKTSVCHATLQDDEQQVQSGLAYTPSDMRNMIKKGYPVAPQNLSDDFFSDTDFRPANNFEVDVFERRSVSINDVWETQQDSRKKVKQAHQQGLFESVNTSE